MAVYRLIRPDVCHPLPFSPRQRAGECGNAPWALLHLACCASCRARCTATDGQQPVNPSRPFVPIGRRPSPIRQAFPVIYVVFGRISVAHFGDWGETRGTPGRCPTPHHRLCQCECQLLCVLSRGRKQQHVASGEHQETSTARSLRGDGTPGSHRTTRPGPAPPEGPQGYLCESARAYPPIAGLWVSREDRLMLRQR